MMTSRCTATIFLLMLLCGRPLAGADLSPGHWPADERAALEAAEADAHAGPKRNRLVGGREGLVAGTMSPIALRVGRDALRQGGTAADAAAAMALTQVTTALGSFVSYAGILQLVYFDAATGQVHALDAGWSSYPGETDPKTIPGPGALEREQGRKTLVPGFMAGIEAMHARFGTLPFEELFAPALWYAGEGVRVSRGMEGAFRFRKDVFSRTEEGRRFLRQAGGPLPRAGDRFVQKELAATLRAVARDGARHMYTGPWGRRYVEAVQRDGGKATLADLARYRPVWQQPLSTTFAGHVVFAPGRGSEGGYQALAALNLIEALKIERMPPYWRDPATFQRLSRVLNLTDLPPRWMLERARAKGVALEPVDRATKEFAAALAPLVDEFFQPVAESAPASTPTTHTAGIVVIDRQGNVAALVHSINTVLWGSTGIVVDGVPVADSAAINQDGLAARTPGERIPDLMVPLIVLREGRPVLAVAITGGVQRETVRVVLGLAANGVDALTLMTAPPLVVENGARHTEFTVPAGAYPDEFLQRLRRLGSTVDEVPPSHARSLRGEGGARPDRSGERTAQQRGGDRALRLCGGRLTRRETFCAVFSAAGARG